MKSDTAGGSIKGTVSAVGRNNDKFNELDRKIEGCRRVMARANDPELMTDLNQTPSEKWKPKNAAPSSTGLREVRPP